MAQLGRMHHAPAAAVIPLLERVVLPDPRACARRRRHQPHAHRRRAARLQSEARLQAHTEPPRRAALGGVRLCELHPSRLGAQSARPLLLADAQHLLAPALEHAHVVAAVAKDQGLRDHRGMLRKRCRRDGASRPRALHRRAVRQRELEVRRLHLHASAAIVAGRDGRRAQHPLPRRRRPPAAAAAIERHDLGAALFRGGAARRPRGRGARQRGRPASTHEHAPRLTQPRATQGMRGRRAGAGKCEQWVCVHAEGRLRRCR